MFFTFRCTVILLISFLFSVNVFSQHRDYIITLKKDTVYGVLKYTLGYATHLIADSASYSVDENNVDAYYESDKNLSYKSRALPGKTRHVFLQCIEQGRINLYASVTTLTSTSPQYGGMVTGSSSSTRLYAEKAEGQIVEVKSTGMLAGNKKERKAFLELINDNKNVVDTYNQNKDFTVADIQYYIHEYNKQAVSQ